MCCDEETRSPGVQKQKRGPHAVLLFRNVLHLPPLFPFFCYCSRLNINHTSVSGSRTQWSAPRVCVCSFFTTTTNKCSSQRTDCHNRPEKESSTLYLSLSLLHTHHSPLTAGSSFTPLNSPLVSHTRARTHIKPTVDGGKQLHIPRRLILRNDVLASTSPNVWITSRVITQESL